ncbi:hypothetical protein YPPY46_4799 [Yersinia pestis PY-46]|uniref:Uncharacterized protein n=2 Tax=Yersinia pestis TaxID=632 RepID=A0AAV3AUU2_YERPE|nr:hypothetical protein YPIP275_1775 [Yersinia pestis biovar Orientalis str. IP275]EFA45808.1 hypothetical protein YPD27_B0115 [Yersinia pestis KIM D27]EIQ97517.1 hypothetical protein YPPY05_4678 [Yersinia pestis PY-05]EIR12049.1 hypothetical protein YPPY06_4888 [Yersinia pestis PY-06]EIR12875.1 hypothetical protein YPPY09_4930 [Yersinia pestis PY-09]EIR26165.1 hypothetical protein YPPY08_4885 [Yersinia pestis PY-08]EIR41163.1 hypothetical protein YPPY12_4951 [Yersinia pestis PY-12]EIR84148.
MKEMKDGAYRRKKLGGGVGKLMKTGSVLIIYSRFLRP